MAAATIRNVEPPYWWKEVVEQSIWNYKYRLLMLYVNI